MKILKRRNRFYACKVCCCSERNVTKGARRRIQRATTVSNEASEIFFRFFFQRFFFRMRCLYMKKKIGGEKRENERFKASTRDIFTITTKGLRRVLPEISIFFVRRKVTFLSFSYEIHDRTLIIGRASRKKWERKSHGRSARDTRDTQTVSEKSSAPK